MKKIVTFGEVMARLCPPDGTRIGQTDRLQMTFGGAEANVAVSLACMGLPASYVTKLPDNALTQAFCGQMRALNVDVGDIALGGERMGMYFVEKAISIRPASIVYDRKHSSISAIQPGDIDWEKAFEGAGWFHWSGITPALSPEAAAEQERACRIAKEMGLTVSCDINYRPALWTAEEAGKAMAPLMRYVDVLIANESEPDLVLGVAAKPEQIVDGHMTHEGYAEMARGLCSRFGIKKCGFAIREGSEQGRYIWSGLVYSGDTGRWYTSEKYDLQIVDRIGGGDAFGAGLIAALNLGMDDARAVRYAAAASALKHTFEGDFNRATRQDVEKLLR